MWPCNTPPARTLLQTPSYTKDAICCICKRNYIFYCYTKDAICCICKINYIFYCSWRWACSPKHVELKWTNICIKLVIDYYLINDVERKLAIANLFTRQPRWKELFTRFTLVDSTALINLEDPCKRAFTHCRLVVTDVSAMSAWPLKSDFKLPQRCKWAYVSDSLTYYMPCLPVVPYCAAKTSV
jgi:hypothetical protein